MKTDNHHYRYYVLINIITLLTFFIISIGCVFAQDQGAVPGYTALDRARAVTGDKIKCPRCGTLNDPTNANCVSCGYPLKGGSGSAPTTVSTPSPEAVPTEEFRRFEAAAPPAVPEGGTPAAPKEEKKYTAIEGVHEWCVKCEKELRKPTKKEILESQLSGYYDNGTHGDEVAGDGIYSNVTEERDRLCDECISQLQALNRLINRTETDNAVEFYMVNVASEDPPSNPPSPIPSFGYWTTQRSDFISDYSARVLAPFKDPITGKFYEHFQFSAEELAAIAAQKLRKKQEQMRAAGIAPGGQYQGQMRPPAMYGTGQPEQFGGSYFGERQGAGPMIH